MRAVLFDLDGVLIDSYGVWHAVINAFAKDHGYSLVSDEQMRLGWGQGVDADAEMFFPGSDVAALEDYYDTHFLDHLEALEVTEGAARVLQRLRAIGCRTAIVTNTPHELAERLVEPAPFVADCVVGTSEALRAKPAPDMLWHACELLRVAPAETFMIGDSVFDRDAASAAGTPFLSYRWDGGRRLDELSQVMELVRSAGSRR